MNADILVRKILKLLSIGSCYIQPTDGYGVKITTDIEGKSFEITIQEKVCYFDD